MRLAVFTSKYPARVATFFERDMRGLIDAGIDIEIFPIYPLDSEAWRYSLNILDENVLPRTKVHHITIGRSLRAIRLHRVEKLKTFLRDVVVVSSSAAKFGIAHLAKSFYVAPKALAWSQEYADKYDHVLAYWGNYAATCAYTFHRLINRPIPFSMWLHAGTDLYRNPVYMQEKLLYADNIITCCEFNRRFIQEHYSDLFPLFSEKIHVSYHGLDFNRFVFQADHRPPLKIIAVGRFAKHKGFDYLLRATQKLVCRGIDVKVELIGDGEQAGALKGLAEELQLGKKVHFRGWLNFEAVRDAMQDATVLVHPSDGLGDGLPNVIREAMALGTPVIASGVAGIPEALDNGRCGILVPPRDIDALTDAIEKLLTDPSLRREYAARARTYAEENFDLWRNGRYLADRLRSSKRSVESVIF